MLGGRTLVAAGLAVALLASCAGGDGGGAGGGEGGQTAPSPAPSTSVAPEPAPGVPAPLRLDLRGLGPVRVGMTVADAGAALGRPLQVLALPTEECTLYAPATGFEGVSFLVAHGVVTRADVSAGTTLTATGVGIGRTEAEAQRAYANGLRVTPHDFLVGGHYLTLVPSEPADAGFRLVLETDGVRVVAMRAGRLPEVERTEGCG